MSGCIICSYKFDGNTICNSTSQSKLQIQRDLVSEMVFVASNYWYLCGFVAKTFKHGDYFYDVGKNMQVQKYSIIFTSAINYTRHSVFPCMRAYVCVCVYWLTDHCVNYIVSNLGVDKRCVSCAFIPSMSVCVMAWEFPGWSLHDVCCAVRIKSRVYFTKPSQYDREVKVWWSGLGEI